MTLLSYFSEGQEFYEKSAGLSLGSTSGLTFKKFFTESEAIELTLSGRNDGLQLGANYQFYRPMNLAFNDRFYLHYGIGGHLGYEKFNDLSKILSNAEGTAFIYERRSFYVMGVDLDLGVEYRWLEVPVTIGFDLRPYLNFIGMRYIRSQFWDAGLSVKYIF